MEEIWLFKFICGDRFGEKRNFLLYLLSVTCMKPNVQDNKLMVEKMNIAYHNYISITIVSDKC